MRDEELLSALRKQIHAGRVAGLPPNEVLQRVCEILHNTCEGYDWVGIYVAQSEPAELVLGPYVGAATEHTRIPFGRGICGQVAESCETLVVPDVASVDNYISCSLDVKSEIVVPILVGNRFAAQNDVDSHSRDRFAPSDRALLEKLAESLAPLFG